jgi:hypothetical protein
LTGNGRASGFVVAPDAGRLLVRVGHRAAIDERRRAQRYAEQQLLRRRHVAQRLAGVELAGPQRFFEARISSPSR